MLKSNIGTAIAVLKHLTWKKQFKKMFSYMILSGIFIFNTTLQRKTRTKKKKQQGFEGSCSGP